MRVSIFLEGNADAGPGSLEAVEGVEPAASAWFRRWISAATAGEVSSEGGEGTMSGAGLSGSGCLGVAFLAETRERTTNAKM